MLGLRIGLELRLGLEIGFGLRIGLGTGVGLGRGMDRRSEPNLLKTTQHKNRKTYHISYYGGPEPSSAGIYHTTDLEMVEMVIPWTVLTAV